MKRSKLIFAVGLAVTGVIIVVALAMNGLLTNPPPAANPTTLTALQNQPVDLASAENGSSESPGQETREAQALTEASSPIPLVIAGRVTVFGLRGEILPTERGFVTFAVHRRGERTETIHSGIEDGRWSLSVPGTSLVEPTAVVWSGNGRSSLTRLVDAEVTPATSAQGMTILATLIPGVRLHVVDAVSGSPLEEVSLVLQRAGDPEARASSRPPDALLSRLPDEVFDSPLLLDQRPGTRVGWVGAVGYAWRRIGFLGSSEGDLTVALERGAAAEVTVTGVPEWARRPLLRVYHMTEGTGGTSGAGELLHEEAIHEDYTAHLDSLPPGETEFCVVPDGSSRACGPRIGQIVAKLEAGRTTHARLDLADESSRETLADLRITIRNHAADRKLSNLTRLALWPDRAPGTSPVAALPLERFIADRLRDSRDLEIQWEGLAPGRYVAAVLPQGAQSEVRLAPAQRASVELVLTSPVEVVVSVLHGREALLARDAVVRFRPSLAQGAASWSVIEGSNQLDGRHRFRCLAGSVQLSVGYPGHATAMRSIEVPAKGPVEFTIQLTPAERLEFELHARQGELEVPVPLSFWERVSIQPLSAGAGRLVGIQMGTNQVGGLSALDAASASFYVDGAGLYEVLLPVLPGVVTSVEPRLEVAIAEGTVAEASFQVRFE